MSDLNNNEEKGVTLTVKGVKGDKGDSVIGLQGIQGVQGIKGDKGEKGDTGSVGISGKDGLNGIDGKNGVNGVDGKDAVIENIEDKINTLVSKIDYKVLKNTPVITNRTVTGISSLRQLTDVDYSGLTQDTQGNYILGSGGGGGGTGFKYIGSDVPDTTDWEVNDLWYDTSTEVS